MIFLRFIRLQILIGLFVIVGMNFTAPAIAATPCGFTSSQSKSVLPNQVSIFKPEVPLPNFAGGPVSGTTIAEYIRAIFVYFIWIVGLLAVFMIIFGGIKWIAAAGDPGRISDARETINNALIGLIIALTPVLLLNTINPNLTNFKGLTIQPVDPCLVAFLSDVTNQTGTVQSCYIPLAGGVPSGVGGEPTQACICNPATPGKVCATTAACKSGYNDWINKYATKYKIDPFMLKAVIEIETYSNGKGYPISEPALVPESIGSSRYSSSYGLSQEIVCTLYSQLKKTNNQLPAECPTIKCPGDTSAAREANGSLISSCAAWLDARLEQQVQLTASYLQEVSTGRCVKGNPTFIAMAYHLGQGGAEAYCSGETLKDTTRSAAVEYVSNFNTTYKHLCDITPATGY